MADLAWTLDLPDPIEVDFGPIANTLAFPSPLEAAPTRTVGRPGTRWLQSLRFNNMQAVKSRPLEGLLARLEGQANRLVLHRVGRPTILGVASGTPLVNGAAQTGSSIQIDGLAPNTIGIFQIGDMVGIGGELKMVTVRCDSNGSGQAALQFKPAQRVAPSDNSAIVYVKPTTRWILADPSVRWTELLAKVVSGHAIDLVETFTAT